MIRQAGLDWKKYVIPRASCDPVGPGQYEVTGPEEMQKNGHPNQQLSIFFFAK